MEIHPHQEGLCFLHSSSGFLANSIYFFLIHSLFRFYSPEILVSADIRFPHITLFSTPRWSRQPPTARTVLFEGWHILKHLITKMPVPTGKGKKDEGEKVSSPIKGTASCCRVHVARNKVVSISLMFNSWPLLKVSLKNNWLSPPAHTHTYTQKYYF